VLCSGVIFTLPYLAFYLNRRVRTQQNSYTQLARIWQGISNCELVFMHGINASGKMEIHFHSLLASALDVAEWSSLHPAPFTSGETNAVTYGYGAGLVPETTGTFREENKNVAF
jgi:hypothetical protein